MRQGFGVWGDRAVKGGIAGSGTVSLMACRPFSFKALRLMI